MNITAILKKLAAGEAITAVEKDFLLANKDILSAEQSAAAEAAVVEASAEEEVVDEKAVSELISKSIAERVDAITTKIAEKFLDGVADSRAKAIDTGKSQATAGDEKTRGFMKALFTNDHASLKAIAGTSDSVGGYLIPTELMSEVLRIAQKQYGKARQYMRYLPFTGPGNERRIPTLASSVSVSWTDEAAEKQSTAPTFDLVTQTLKKLAAIVPMTEEIIEDSTINLTALIAELFAEAVAKEEDLQFFNGTGSPWTGVLNNGSVTVVNTLTTDPADVTADDLLALVDATPTGALDGASFFMHRSIFSKIRTLKASTAGSYLVESPTATAPASIWGYPIVLTDAFPAVTVTGNDKPFVMFGNLGVCAIFGDKQQLRVKLLDQATVNNTTNNGSINLAQQDMVAVRIVERVGYVLAQPAGITVLKTVSAGS